MLIAPGVYREAVTVRTPGIAVRGLDRNAVVFDGEGQKENGILVAADGVAVENLTVRRYAVNGLLFTKAYDDGDPTQHTVLDGYRASYVTASNNGLYGIYAFFARGGQIDHAYVSGHPDSGIDIGQCKPCDAVVTDSVTEDIPSFFECQPMDRFSTSATCGRHTASPSGAVDEQSGEVRRRSPTDSSWSVRESFLACDCTCSGSAPLQARPPPVMAFNDGFAPPERQRRVAGGLVGPTILQWGTEEQKKHFLPQILKGRSRAALASASRTRAPTSPSCRRPRCSTATSR